MASTTTPLIGLFKATPGTNEPFRTADINNNWDILDSFIVGYQTQFDVLANANSTALANFNASANGSINEFNSNSNAALDEFSDSQAELDAAIASLDTAAILEELELGFAIDGGTA
jgi:multidrug resistance efflux pump